MTDIIKKLLSRAPRFQVKCDDDVIVTLERPDAEFETIKAKLANLSAGGAKLKVGEAISVDETLAVCIASTNPVCRITVAGKVCWVDPSLDGWWLGCSFQPLLPADALDSFSRAGILERREHPRYESSLRTSALWEMTSEPLVVWILNYSRGGFCLLSQTPGDLGERLRLEFLLDDGQTAIVRGKTTWQVESVEGYVMGCSFIDPSDVVVLRELADPEGLQESFEESHAVQPREDVGDAKRPRHTFLLAACALLMVVAAALPWLPPFSSDANIVASPDNAPQPEPQARTSFASRLDTEPVVSRKKDVLPTSLHEFQPTTPIEKSEPPRLAALSTPRSLSAPAFAFEHWLETPSETRRDATNFMPRHDPGPSAPAGLRKRSTSARVQTFHYRTWTDVSGQFSVRARIVAVDGRLLRLERANGRSLSVSLDRLSADDVRYVRRWLATTNSL